MEKQKLLEKSCTFRNVKELEFNTTQFQKSDSNSCGLFTLYFIFERMHNLDLNFHEILEEIFDAEDIEINEEKVAEFVKSVCN